MVRDGVYVSEDDAAMRLTGVYVAATGRLLAVAEPAAPVLAVPLDAGEGAESLDYRRGPHLCPSGDGPFAPVLCSLHPALRLPVMLDAIHSLAYFYAT